MKGVEKKGFNSKREMEILDALNEVKLLNKRQAVVNHDQLLLKLVQTGDQSDEIDTKVKMFVERKKFKRIDSDSDVEEISAQTTINLESALPASHFP